MEVRDMRFKYVKASSRLLTVALAACALLITSTAVAQDDVYVTKAGSPAPTGTLSDPYQLVEAGIVRTMTSPASTVQIAAGKYYETFTTDTPCILKATGGTVTIGKLDYQASTTLEIITLNTHLAGDQWFMPSWQDYERADDIADFFGGPNPTPDVVGFQEIWDEDLFFGGDGANGIRPRSGYLYGDHGDDGWPANSGCALMSKFPLADFVQVEWGDCSGVDCGANKGWVQATIVKDGFSIGMFNLHADADADEDDVEARFNQMVQLKNAVNSYRTAHPSHVGFVMGDFNIYGEETEYSATLTPQVGIGAGGRDADRNAPGFVFGSSEQWTVCDCNPLAMYFDDETVSGRLDYIFYFPSLDGSVEVIPMSVEVLPFIGRTLTEDDLTTSQSSDHWSVYGQFKLVVRS
jgi:hypothetical protein